MNNMALNEPFRCMNSITLQNLPVLQLENQILHHSCHTNICHKLVAEP